MRATAVGVGLLGADFKVDNNLYVVEKIIAVNRWNTYGGRPTRLTGAWMSAEGAFFCARSCD